MKKAYSFIYALLRIFFTPLYPMRYIGRENIPDGAAVICANHSGSSDPVLVAFALRRKAFPRFMAKEELLHVPVLGKVLKAAGVFFVARHNSDIEAVRTAMRHLKNGEKVMIFPEGTRVSESEAIAAKNGAIRLAMKMKVPIVPIWVPRNKRKFRRDLVIIGQPYMLEDAKRADFDLLSEQLMEKINGLGRGLSTV